MVEITTKSNFNMMFSKKIILSDHEWIVVSATIKYVLKNLLDPKSETAMDLEIIRDKIINAKQE